MATEIKGSLKDLFHPAIQDLITRAAQEEMDDIMVDIQERVRARLAKEVAGVAVHLMEYVRMELMGTELVIRVELPKKENRS